MSIPVDVADLDRALGAHDDGYLLTVSADGRVKVVSTTVRVEDGLLVVPAPGRGSLRNVGLQPQVTLLWPPRDPGGHTLLVDGIAATAPDGLRVRPTGAVLHRSAEHPDG